MGSVVINRSLWLRMSPLQGPRRLGDEERDRASPQRACGEARTKTAP